VRIGLYPGTFDPVTLGHNDIIRRAIKLVDKLVIGVAINRDKGPMFTLEERVAMVEAECAQLSARTGTDIVVHPFENLLIDCARDVGAGIIIRGLRAVADFEYEFQMVGLISIGDVVKAQLSELSMEKEALDDPVKDHAVIGAFTRQLLHPRAVLRRDVGQ
jgi:pantetheine-phosphate adenylyltransferase